MDVLSNLNKNIFGENHKHASDSINFSAQPPPVKTNQKIFVPKSDKNNKEEQKEPKIITKTNNLSEIEKEKPKKKEKSDDLSYSTYNKNELKNIRDPLSQMRPNSTFGYPTKKKEPKENKIKENKEKENKEKENKEKEKEKEKKEKNNTNTGNQKTREAVMTGLFGDYSNINLNKNKMFNNVTPMPMNQNTLNNNNINAAMVMNYMNLINMQNSLNQQNMILNMYNNNNLNNQTNNNMNNINTNQNINKTPNNLNKNIPKKSNNINTERNELGQVFKVGDLYSDTNLIRKKLNIMESESIKDISKATLNDPDTRYMGVLVLTDFRLIFKMENELYLNHNYSEDYFKIPLFLISKLEKVQDKKMSFNAIPIEITLKDTRVIKFHLYDLQRFYYNLSDLTNPVDYKQFYDFPKKYNKIRFQGKNITNGWKIYDPIIEFSRQGVTEDNDLGLRYCYINKNFQICSTYPEFLIEPKDISDEELKQSSSYRTKGRIPIFSYYYKGDDNTGLKVTPSIWRSAQNKRGLVGNKSCAADVNLLNSISKLGGDNGKLYITQLYIFAKLKIFIKQEKH